jgi:hypothetical protein
VQSKPRSNPLVGRKRKPGAQAAETVAELVVAGALHGLDMVIQMPSSDSEVAQGVSSAPFVANADAAATQSADQSSRPG